MPKSLSQVHSPAVVAVQAVLFDLDGVLTPTALIHRQAWRVTFEEYFAGRGIRPMYSEWDYLRHLNGKPRYQAVRDLLASRGICLPETGEGNSVADLAERKNDVFNQALDNGGIAPYPDAVSLVQALAAAQLPMAVVSSSRNAQRVLAASGLLNCFTVVVDGVTCAERGLPGKPHPAAFLLAAEQLGCAPEKTAVVEDALAGVKAACAGGFQPVLAVDRAKTGAELLESSRGVAPTDLPINNADSFLQHGATAVLSDLSKAVPYLLASSQSSVIWLEAPALAD
ncbi:MAG: beta-phosphoglucomutase family hydrolase [Bifidobacteriaceae bacterium]|nr:beta-phosphoglucomutase family hydrolase [Bifidobacteriaceae bacterium]